MYNAIQKGRDAMPLSIGEKIRVLMNRRGMTLGALAKTLGTTRQNLSNKLSRDNFSEREVREIAEALNCTYEAKLIMRDTGEEV